MKPLAALLGALVVLFAIAALLGYQDAVDDDACERARRAGLGL